MVTSGIRIGTPALTTRGFKVPEMREVGAVIVAALAPEITEAELAVLRDRSKALGDRFPLYPKLRDAAGVS
jgi:glycine hydroxymethyltransferase